MSTLSERIGALVNAVYPQGTNAAATAMGIPQATLYKILAGKSENPRAGTLRDIAAHFDASVDWLLTGVGQPPECLRDSDFMATRRVLDALGVNAVGRQCIESLADGLFRNLDEAFTVDERIGDTRSDLASHLALYAKRRERARLADEVIAATLEVLTAKMGPKRAREQLQHREVQNLLALMHMPLRDVLAPRVIGDAAAGRPEEPAARKSGARGKRR